MKPTKNELKRFERILYDLKTKGSSQICPFPERNYQCSRGKRICTRIFPSLKRKKNIAIHGEPICPCPAIGEGMLSLDYVIKKVKKIIRRGEM